MVHRRAQLRPEVASGWALDSAGPELLKRMHAGLVHTPRHTRSGRVEEKAGALTVYQTRTFKSLSVQRQHQHSINSPWEGASHGLPRDGVTPSVQRAVRRWSEEGPAWTRCVC